VWVGKMLPRRKAAGCRELVESGIAKVYCGTTNEPQMRRNDSATCTFTNRE
jgi:hypothetical protein